MNSKLDKLRTAFLEFQAIPFPCDSSDEALSLIHAELAEYDGYVAGLISQLAAGTMVLREKFEIDANLRRRLLKISETTKEKADANRYLEYLDRIDQLILLARRV